MSDQMPLDGARHLRARARLLEFLKFRVLAAQESFFEAWCSEATLSTAFGATLPSLDLVAFRGWLAPLWPDANALSDEDLRHCLEQAHRLYVDPPPRRQV